jgi:hypothetical protein
MSALNKLVQKLRGKNYLSALFGGGYMNNDGDKYDWMANPV